MVIRALLLLLALPVSACGGSKSSSPAVDTTPSNRGGSSGPSPTPSSAADARVVQRTQAGGVIELTGDRSGAMNKASEEMSAHCGPNNFSIVQEGEEVIGADTTSGGAVRTQTAWRVHYQCATR